MSATMKRWVVQFTRIPTNHHDAQCLVVEASTAEDAQAIAKDHLRDLGSLSNYAYVTRAYVLPPEGKILEGVVA